MNYQRLHLYMGVMARGEKKDKKPVFYTDRIGPGTLLALRETPDLYEIRPILKPARLLNDKTNKDVRAALDYGYTIVPSQCGLMSSTIKFQSAVISFLREKGYDCDGLIDQGLAVCDPAYDLTKLL